ncbi:MAG: HlyD family efflux transporter periplasmic adaptor subunit [Pseudomonadota bacterium]
MRLRNRKSHLTTLPEGKPPRKPAMSLVRLLYFGALLAFLAYLLAYAWERMLYVEARGHVAMQRHLLQTDREGILRGLTLRVGEAVRRGQPLFRIEQEVVEDRRDQAVWEDLKVRREIGLKRAALAALRTEIADRQARLDQLAQLRLLELDRLRQREYAALAQELAADRIKAAGLAEEIAALQGYLGGVRGQGVYRRQIAAMTYASPFDGFVYRLEKGEHEFAHKGDTVIVLEDAREVRVVAYFALEDLPSLKPGRRLEILLPDGQTHMGEIERIDSATLDHEERLARGYEPLEALVRVQIRPDARPADIDWRSYNQLDVKVRFHSWD